MQNKELEGIVVSFRDYRENDAILHVLCKEFGVINIVARGIQKVKSKNAPACQLFTHVRMQIQYSQTKTLHSLIHAEIIHSYRKIREDLLKQSIASFFCECMDVSHFEDDEFNLLESSLTILEQTNHPMRILCLFQSCMNRLHGIEPYVDGCVRCGSNKNIVALSMLDGGFVCRHCTHLERDEIKTKEELKYFRLLCKAKFEHYDILCQFDDFTFNNFLDLYQFFYEYSGISLKSIKFLKMVANME